MEVLIKNLLAPARRPPISRSRTQRLAETLLARERTLPPSERPEGTRLPTEDAELSVVFCDDAFIRALLALLAGVIYGLTRAELLVLLFSIALVLIAEMFNTAVEAVVDLVTQSYHPLAKHAKDVAAGAVLVAALNAIVVGLILFFNVDRMEEVIQRKQGAEPGALQTIVITMVLLLVLLVIWKVLGGKGTFLHGGVVSGHAAVGFCVCTIILLLSHDPFVAFLAILMALIIAQSRVEAGVHSLQEVFIGALLGIA